jgi:hypothetical protein
MGKAWTPSIVPSDQTVYLVMDDLGIVCFNAAEGWCRNVSEDVAKEIRLRCDLQLSDVPSSVQDFVERHERYDRQQLTLRLVQHGTS